MLKLSNIPLEVGLRIFAETGIDVAFLVPTPTGHSKSIMDATGPVRDLLRNTGIHDYSAQSQGQAHKALVKTFLMTARGKRVTKTSLYRPKTKNGDPRIWIYDLKRYCKPCDLLALTTDGTCLYVFNLSLEAIRDSFAADGSCAEVLKDLADKPNPVAEELLQKLRDIHARGFIPSVTRGDPGVGDTLEHALHIRRNNSRLPDYKGIELKAQRLSRNGKLRSQSRSNLFSRVPDDGLNCRQILDRFGKTQVVRRTGEKRFQLCDTITCTRVNGYGLTLDIDYDSSCLRLMHQAETGKKEYVSAWEMRTLEQGLLQKHKETFWVGAQSEMQGNKEYFRYDIARYSKKPNESLIAPLLEEGLITVDFSGHYHPDGTYGGNHGPGFKMKRSKLGLLFASINDYEL